jgi:hypothetical protein
MAAVAIHICMGARLVCGLWTLMRGRSFMDLTTAVLLWRG